MVDKCVGARLVALLTPSRDGLDVAAVFVATVRQCRTRTGEMAADGVGAAGPVRPFGGDHRQRDVRPRMVWVFSDRGGKGGRGAVLDREQATHTFGVRRRGTGQRRRSRDETGCAHRLVAGAVGEQFRDSRCLRADFGNRGGFPLLALTDRADADDVGDRAPAPSMR